MVCLVVSILTDRHCSIEPCQHRMSLYEYSIYVCVCVCVCVCVLLIHVHDVYISYYMVLHHRPGIGVISDLHCQQILLHILLYCCSD